MSGGQDPTQWDWEVSSSCEAFKTTESLESIARKYLASLDEANMVEVYRLRSLMRDKVSESNEKARPAKGF
jgi:hypothetical protein